jgi:hypothetical protein
MIFKSSLVLLPFGKNASAATPEGTTLPEYAPLIAIFWIEGNLRQITESNSKPDMPGMLRSVIRMSGISSRIARNAEKPSTADRTWYPSCVRISAIDIRIEGSSSTMRILAVVSGISHLIQDSTSKTQLPRLN